MMLRSMNISHLSYCVERILHMYVVGQFTLWQSQYTIRLPRIPIVFMNTRCWHWFALQISCRRRFETEVDCDHHFHYIKHHSFGFYYKHICNKSTLERGENPPSHSKRYKIFFHPKESHSLLEKLNHCIIIVKTFFKQLRLWACFHGP